jgi:hypothetical protein
VIGIALCGKACGNIGYWQRKKKLAKRKKENRPMEKWKTQKARFPLSHRARCQKQERGTEEANQKGGGLTAALSPRRT